MNELALFAGAGGGILGGKLLGWKTVCAVEIEEYPRNVLLARQDDGCLPPFPVWDDIRTFDGKPWSGVVDCISGGFPCQDISVCGKGAGIEGERSGLWSEMRRIISEVRPSYVFVENSPALTFRGGFELLETWPRWATWDATAVWVDSPWEGVQTESVCGSSLLRPTAQCWKAWTFRNLSSLIRRNHADGNIQEQSARCFRKMITPGSNEILMMWPMGWTDLRPLGTDKIHSWQHSHGDF